MAQVFFSFRSEVPEGRQTELLAELRREPGVEQAAALKPDTHQVSLRRHCYALIKDETTADRLVTMLRQWPEVESAERPPWRGLGIT
jgi:hypothetical protein